ncbi:class I SAM-dependent methyltransferase [Umezawaea endophytica]|uniref:Class I SAM-dependent methyltransferase n=1 Tax=Umezawaea endophytica TaxID=1654476 RepID=A0A9X2VJJ5_9PSEU|nr:class I SAM-dependent methyltransferase [Umezawaea endophytica]MCS7477805.1 class I SAM-dependent methyltransferase [Umezawaea endophytica]
MDLSTVAVPHTLAHLTPLLPAPPARVLEVGCGRGALAAALIDVGYEVTGVDRDAGMAAAAAERGVPVLHADVRDVSGEYDVVLFTRSLHHAEVLDEVLGHAAGLLAVGGQLVVEEFAWERVDRSAADFLYDTGALLVAAGLLTAEIPTGDLLEAWVGGHDHLHCGSSMLAALSRLGPAPTTVDTAMLWRLLDGRGGAWTEPRNRVPGVLDALRRAEERRVAAGTLPAVGLLAAVRR